MQLDRPITSKTRLGITAIFFAYILRDKRGAKRVERCGPDAHEDDAGNEPAYTDR